MSETQADDGPNSTRTDYDGLEQFDEDERRRRSAAIRQLKVAIQRLTDPETDIVLSEAGEYEHENTAGSIDVHETSGDDDREVLVIEHGGDILRTGVHFELEITKPPETMFTVVHGTAEERYSSDAEEYTIKSMADVADLPDDVKAAIDL